MQQVGYAFLKAQLALSAFSVTKPAVVAPVNRIALFEAFTGHQIEGLPPLTAPYADLFDADR